MITTMNQLLALLVEHNEIAGDQNTVAVRMENGQIFRINDIFFDRGDDYVVIGIEDNPVNLAERQSQPSGKFGTSDIYDKWQCYSGTEGNRLMEELFQRLVRGLESGEITRNTLELALEEGMDDIPADTGAHDTEPRNAIKDELDEVLYNMGYRKIWEY